MASCKVCLDLCANLNTNLADSSFALLETPAPTSDVFMPWDNSISYSLPRSESLLEWRESAQHGCVYCSILMDGLDQLQQASWYRDGLELSDEATFEVVNTKPLHVKVEDWKGRSSRSIRTLYFYASTGQYAALLARPILVS